MKILLLNYPYLQDELIKNGAQVISAGSSPDCNLCLSGEDYNLSRILSEAPFTPDFIIFMDSIERNIPAGLEDCPAPLIVFLLDTPINRFWQFPLARIADLTLCDQLPEAVFLQNSGLRAEWFPLAADRNIYLPRTADKTIEISFVGGRNLSTRMKREYILDAISGKFNLKTYTGSPYLSAAETADVYRRSKLVLNENMFPAVNLRLFEAMSCGTAVFTEDSAPGLENLFADSQNLVTYNPEVLLDKISFYLDNDHRRKDIAISAGEIIDEKHTLKARASRLLEVLNSLQPQNQSADDRRLNLARCYLNFGLKWNKKHPLSFRHAQKLAETDDSPQSLILKGDLALQKQQFISAAECFIRAAGHPETGWEPWLKAGMTLLETGDSISAKVCLRKTLETAGYTDLLQSAFSPGSAEFHFFWGKFLQAQNASLEPGLMKFHLPMAFWSGLEHLSRAGNLDNRYFEFVGDLLSGQKAFDAALQAYQLSGNNSSVEKKQHAAHNCYADINK